MKASKIETFDAYIKSLPKKDQEGFKSLHDIIIKSAPDTEMAIGYGMPCLKLKGIILYYASHTSHYSIYPGPATIEAFKEDLTKYVTSKGTIQFDHDKALPKKLIGAIVKFRLHEKKAQNELKKTKK